MQKENVIDLAAYREKNHLEQPANEDLGTAIQTLIQRLRDAQPLSRVNEAAL